MAGKRYEGHAVDGQDIDLLTKITAMYAKMDSHDLDDPILDRRGTNSPEASLENRAAVQDACIALLDGAKQVAMESAFGRRREMLERYVGKEIMTWDELNQHFENANNASENVEIFEKRQAGKLEILDSKDDVYGTVTYDRTPELEDKSRGILQEFTTALRENHAFDAMEIGVEKMRPEVRANLEGLPKIPDMSLDDAEAGMFTSSSGTILFGHDIKDPYETLVGLAKAYAQANFDDIAKDLNKQAPGVRAARLLFQREAGPEFQATGEKLKEQAAVPAGPGY